MWPRTLRIKVHIRANGHHGGYMWVVDDVLSCLILVSESHSVLGRRKKDRY